MVFTNLQIGLHALFLNERLLQHIVFLGVVILTTYNS